LKPVCCAIVTSRLAPQVDVKGMGDDTPLHDAAMNGHDDVIALLFRFNANPVGGGRVPGRVLPLPIGF
jgi:hypothetical protein